MKNFTQKHQRTTRRLIFTFFVGLFAFSQATAQVLRDTVIGKPAVKVQARAIQTQVKLRWAPNRPVAWQYGNQYGYQLEKYLVFKNGQILSKPQKIATSKAEFKPLPLNAWEKVANSMGKAKENYALVAAQALYGEGFGLTTNGKKNTELKKIINRVKEQDMRFAYALMASDHAPKVAEASGLAWTDTKVKKGEKYLYKIFIKLPATVNYRVDTGYVYTGVDDYEALPKPIEFSATFGNRTVMLTWNRWYHERFYVAYWVERSADGGKTYQKTTKAPIGNVLQEEVGIQSRFLYRIDSLPNNEQTYHYRVRGLTSFGELGPPSETIAGQGWANNLPLPKLTQPTLQTNGSVKLSWTFPVDKQKDIVGFVVEKSRRASGAPYKVLHAQKTLPTNTRDFTDLAISGVAYYRLGIVSKKPLGGTTKTVSSLGGKKNNEPTTPATTNIKYTYPFLVQQPDTTAPQPPTLVTGVIDSAGKVILNWKPSIDDDVEGYRVYRANYAGEEFSQITKVMVNDTVFIDSVTVKSLTSQVLYKVQAVDEYVNPSEFSAVAVLRRPDVVPPVPPVFTQVVSADTGVHIAWQASSSIDVARHALYRQQRGKANEWVLIKAFMAPTLPKTQADTGTQLPGHTMKYTDKSLEVGVDYQYTVIAIDSSNLESPPAKPVTGRKIDKGIRGEVKKLRASTSSAPVEVTLRWKYDYSTTPESFTIYKGEELSGLKLYTTIKGELRTWTDKKVERNRSYKYRIQANFKGGAVSKFSKLVIASF
ncbi:fibronectin type III domain-containing protein [Microscilla marina]|uniref:Fibronectin type III domain protein n=1 Tax=Microscilla marina ATCC 23134 TaxID=313606 RepID=A1ZSG9_MICM2|nr:hypothetical protein [Microscilla marina]EAY26717.1 fibronectin type III domain protein [Microscilla marina ATCC 23134]